MYIGLDLGTSGLRALLVAREGEVIASHDYAYEVSHLNQGWSEQNPADWISALDHIFHYFSQHHGKEFQSVKAIGIAGHMHGATLLDENHKIIYPCILWNDTRSYAEAAELDAMEGVRETSGNIVFPGFTAPKLVWLRRHKPEIFNQISKVLLPKDYLGFYLTGELVGEMSDAAGTGWLDTQKRQWSHDLLEKSGLSVSHMPRLIEGSQVAGTIRKDLCEKWKLSSDCVVVGGGADNAVSACGVGALREGEGFVSLGTSGVLLAAKNEFSPMPASAVHTFCHAIPNTWYQMGVMLAATDSLNWLAKNLQETSANLAGRLGDELHAPGRVYFVPYLSGERTPHNDSQIRGAFIGLDIGTDHNGLTAAVMEGVGFALRDNFEALKQTGTQFTRLLGIGGGSQSRYWVEMLATLFNVPIDLPQKGEFGAAYGAARLAICGHTGANPIEVMSAPKIARTIAPNTKLIDAYEASYQTYRTLYPKLRNL